MLSEEPACCVSGRMSAVIVTKPGCSYLSHRRQGSTRGCYPAPVLIMHCSGLGGLADARGACPRTVVTASQRTFEAALMRQTGCTARALLNSQHEHDPRSDCMQGTQRQTYCRQLLGTRTVARPVQRALSRLPRPLPARHLCMSAAVLRHMQTRRRSQQTGPCRTTDLGFSPNHGLFLTDSVQQQFTRGKPSL